MQITITGATQAELLSEALSVVELLGGTSAKAASILSPTEQAKLRQEAVVVAPKTDTATKAAADKAEKTAAAKAKKEADAKAAAEKAAAEVAAAGASDEPDEDTAEEEVDPLADDEDSADEEALTRDDVKKLLVEVREAFPAKTTIIKDIVVKFGKVDKLSDVTDANLPAVAKEARRLLAAKK